MAQVEDTATDSITPESVFARHPRSGDVDGVFLCKITFRLPLLQEPCRKRKR